MAESKHYSQLSIDLFISSFFDGIGNYDDSTLGIQRDELEATHVGIGNVSPEDME